jgi:bifunctional non-homologous end joining protein LigD
MKKAARKKSPKLATYRRKRDFARTPEPRGSRSKARESLLYVVQKHDATRLHYDFRLEHRGVLKSWAVPKEPSLNPKDRRLAVQTEDHPLEYGGFEGEIPEGEYGAGSVLIWDEGSWTPLGDAEQGLKDGKLDFELQGRRLKGRWTLVHMAERNKRKRAENWLLIKRNDAKAKTTTAARSRATPTKRKRRRLDPKDVPGARRSELPKSLSPQLATPVKQPPVAEGWIFEPKLDGYRVLCRIENGRAKILTRRGNDWTDRFSAITEAAQALPCRSAVLDGEAVVLDARGLTSFQSLQNALAEGGSSIVLVAFDILHLDGWDLRGAALRERKKVLRDLLDAAPQAIRYSEHVEENGAAFFEEACRLGLEGVIAKRAEDPYREVRTKSWLKVKCQQREEFVIVGFTDPSGSRTGLGALLLGTRKETDSPLRYAGKVGTGFNERSLKMLRARLEPLQRPTPPVEPSSARGVARGVHWVEPKLAAEIAYSEWTADGRLRHPIFRGLREDKPAKEIVKERPLPPEKASPQPPKRSARRRVKLSNPDKVLFPEPGITKRQLAAYWEEVAEVALPLLQHRPLTLYRCPAGYAHHCFYQKHVGAGVPDVVPRVTIRAGEDPYAMIEDESSLVGLAQIGVLEVHVWGSRAEHIEQPDVIVFDLDPAEDVPWSEVVAAGFEVKARLEGLGLKAFAKLTGGKGLHVVVPVVPGPDWPAVKQFAREVVNEMVRNEPKRFIASMSKAKRAGKIFIDYLRNDREATAIGAYSPRARAGAPVALPVEWDELSPAARSAPRFGVLDVPKLIRKRKRDPWESFESARRSLVD